MLDAPAPGTDIVGLSLLMPPLPSCLRNPGAQVLEGAFAFTIARPSSAN